MPMFDLAHHLPKLQVLGPSRQSPLVLLLMTSCEERPSSPGVGSVRKLPEFAQVGNGASDESGQGFESGDLGDLQRVQRHAGCHNSASGGSAQTGAVSSSPVPGHSGDEGGCWMELTRVAFGRWATLHGKAEP